MYEYRVLWYNHGRRFTLHSWSFYQTINSTKHSQTYDLRNCWFRCEKVVKKLKEEKMWYLKRRWGAVFRNCCKRFPKISQGFRSGTLNNFLRKFLSLLTRSNPSRTDKLLVVFKRTIRRSYTNIMLFFRNEMTKMLSLAWSKKNFY